MLTSQLSRPSFCVSSVLYVMNITGQKMFVVLGPGSWVVGHGLLVVGHGLLVVGHGLLVVGHGLWVMGGVGGNTSILLCC